MNGCEGALIVGVRRPWWHPVELAWAALWWLVICPLLMASVPCRYLTSLNMAKTGCPRCGHDAHKGRCVFLSAQGATSPIDYIPCKCGAA